MNILDLTLRDAIKLCACGLFVGAVLWLPVIVALLRAKP